MATNYPGGYDNFQAPGTNLDDPPHDELHIDIQDAVEAMQAEYGLNPRGSYATVRARLDAHDKYGCSLRRVSNQSATGSGASTAVSWDTEDVDIGGFWSSGTTLTVPTSGAGVYGITARVVGASGWGAGSVLQVVVAGNTYLFDRASTSSIYTATVIQPMTAGSTCVVTMINAGSTQNMTALIHMYRLIPG